MIIADFECAKCGIREHLITSEVREIKCCGVKAKRIYSVPKILGLKSFNPHYDQQQGQWFGSAEEKKSYLKSKGKEQVSGFDSPRKSGKGSYLCSKEQARKAFNIKE